MPTDSEPFDGGGSGGDDTSTQTTSELEDEFNVGGGSADIPPEGTTSTTTTPGSDPSTADDPFADSGSGGETTTFDPDAGTSSDDTDATSDASGRRGGADDTTTSDTSGGGTPGADPSTADDEFASGDTTTDVDTGSDRGPEASRRLRDDAESDPFDEPTESTEPARAPPNRRRRRRRDLTPEERRALENRRANNISGSNDPDFRGDIFDDPAAQNQARERIEQELLKGYGMAGEAGNFELEAGEVEFSERDGQIIGTVEGWEAIDIGDDRVLTSGGQELAEVRRRDQARREETGQGVENAIRTEELAGIADDTPRALETGQGPAQAEIQQRLAGIAADTGGLESEFALTVSDDLAGYAADTPRALETGQGPIQAQRQAQLRGVADDTPRALETGQGPIQAARQSTLSAAVAGMDVEQPPIETGEESFTERAERIARGAILEGELPGEGAPITGGPVLTIPGEVSGAPGDVPLVPGPSVAQAVGGGTAGSLVEGVTGFAAAQGLQGSLAERGLGPTPQREEEFLRDLGIPTAASAAAVSTGRGVATGGLPGGVAGAAGFALGLTSPGVFPPEQEIPEDGDALPGSELSIQEDPRFLPELLAPTEPSGTLATGRFQPPEIPVTDDTALLGGPEVSVDVEGGREPAFGGTELPLPTLQASQQLVGQRQRPRERPSPTRRRRGRTTVPDEFIPEGGGTLGGIGGGVVFNPGTRSIDEQLIETPLADIDVAGIDPELARVMREGPIEAAEPLSTGRTSAVSGPLSRSQQATVPAVGQGSSTSSGQTFDPLTGFDTGVLSLPRLDTVSAATPAQTSRTTTATGQATQSVTFSEDLANPFATGFEPATRTPIVTVTGTGTPPREPPITGDIIDLSGDSPTTRRRRRDPFFELDLNELINPFTGR